MLILAAGLTLSACGRLPFGEGEAVGALGADCKAWLADRDAKGRHSLEARAWVEGYLSAYNAFSSERRAFSIADTQNVVNWIDGRCGRRKTTPADSIKQFVAQAKR